MSSNDTAEAQNRLHYQSQTSGRALEKRMTDAHVEVSLLYLITLVYYLWSMELSLVPDTFSVKISGWNAQDGAESVVTYDAERCSQFIQAIIPAFLFGEAQKLLHVDGLFLTTYRVQGLLVTN